MFFQTNYKSIVIVAILVAIWSFHFLYPIYYNVAISKIENSQQQIIRSNKNASEYEMVTLGKNCYKHLKKSGKEIELRGMLYDIVSVKENGDAFICTILKDASETKLVKANDRSLKEHSSIKIPKQFSFSWYTEEMCQRNEKQPSYFIDNQTSYFLDEKIENGHFYLPIKPPDFS